MYFPKIVCFSRSAGLLLPVQWPTCKLLTREFSYRLEEVGQWETPKTQGPYQAGQFFLHNVFGYRGVILYPWMGKLHERRVVKDDAEPDRTDESRLDDTGQSQSWEVPRPNPFYQVLIDMRDMPHIKPRMLNESVTLMSVSKKGPLFYSIPGLDYVSHTDIIPYRSTQSMPCQNPWFEKFLMQDTDSGTFIALETFDEWLNKKYRSLEVTNVYQETTEVVSTKTGKTRDKVRVTITPFYLGTREADHSPLYWWRYVIRIENLGSTTFFLRWRKIWLWSTTSTIEEKRSPGVTSDKVPIQPKFSATDTAFQLTSHMPLCTPSGWLWGLYTMQREDGSTFTVKIPSVSLESRKEDATTPHGYID